jgi:hypothetical protein
MVMPLVLAALGSENFSCFFFVPILAICRKVSGHPYQDRGLEGQQAHGGLSITSTLKAS